MPAPGITKHPGKILEEEFLSAHNVSQYRVAVDTGVPPRRINEIVLGKRGITADTALRLARYFGNEPLFWMQLQARWDLQRAQDRLGSALTKVVRRLDQPAAPRPPRRRRPDRPATTPVPREPDPTPPEPAPAPKLADHLL